MEENNQFNIGFNQGYILNKYSKSTFQNFSNFFQNSNYYTQGFAEGEKEAELELSRIRSNELNKLRSRNQNDLDLER